jgi:hypothetical protein
VQQPSYRSFPDPQLSTVASLRSSRRRLEGVYLSKMNLEQTKSAAYEGVAAGIGVEVQ